MKMPGFTAELSLGPAVGKYREHSSLFVSRGTVVTQMDSVVLEVDETDEGGGTTHVTVSVFTPFDPESEPAGFEGYGFSWASAGGRPGWAVKRCRERCDERANGRKLACALEEDVGGCVAKEDLWADGCKQGCAL